MHPTEALITKYVKRRQIYMLASLQIFLLWLAISIYFIVIAPDIAIFFSMMGMVTFVFYLLLLYMALVRLKPENSLLLGGKYRNWEIKRIAVRRLDTMYWYFIIPVFWTCRHQIFIEYTNKAIDQINIKKEHMGEIREYLQQKFPGKVH